MSKPQHIIVLGAGVTGLTSANFLAEAGYEVTVIAAHVPGDSSIEYTSPWAGAHWRTSALPDDPRQCDWDAQTYNYWLEVLEREKHEPDVPKSGLKMFETLDYWDGVPTEEMWWAPHVKNFRTIADFNDPIRALNARMSEHMAPIMHGVAYDAFCINVPQYLLYLQEKGRKMGVKVVKARLPVNAGLLKALDAANTVAKREGRRNADCFVNATGLGAKKLCGDDAMYPIRGQTVLVKGEANATSDRFGDFSGYCIPRPGSGMTILGGTKQAGNWSEAVDPETTKQILEKCSYLAPELLTGPNDQFEVVSVQCGLRPGREGGARIEKEHVNDYHEEKVVHAYGHGGAGYQNSVGSARLVVQLVNEFLGTDVVQARL